MTLKILKNNFIKKNTTIFKNGNWQIKNSKLIFDDFKNANKSIFIKNTLFENFENDKLKITN